MAFVQQEIPIRHGYDIGIGVDMATGSPMALGAVGDVTPPQIGTGGSEDFTFRRIVTTSDLETELSVGVDVSGGIGLFSASASFDFSKRCKIQSSSLTILLSCYRTFSFQQMDSPTLSPAAAACVANGQVEQFANQFGNYFVRGISTGGRFIGVVRIDTRTAQTKSDLDAAFSGSYGLTVDADVKAHIAEAVTRTDARGEAYILSDGGTITTHPEGNDPITLINQMFTAMDEWHQSVKGDAMAYTVTVAPYAIALGPPPPNLADLENQRTVLVRCAKLRAQTLDNLNLVEYILDPEHATEFDIVPPPAGPDLPGLQAALAGDLDVIDEAASYAIDNVKAAVEPETYMRTVRGVTGFTLTQLPATMPHQHANTSGGWVQRPTPGLPKFRAIASERGNPSPPTMLALLAAEDGSLWKMDDGAGGIIVAQPAPGPIKSVTGPDPVGVDVNGHIWHNITTTPLPPRTQIDAAKTGGSPAVFACRRGGVLWAVTADGNVWAEVSALDGTSRWDQVALPVPVRKIYLSWGTFTRWALPSVPGTGLVWQAATPGAQWQVDPSFVCTDIALDVAGSTLWMLEQDGSIWTTTGGPQMRTKVGSGDFVAIAGGFQAHTAMALASDGTIWDLHGTT